MSVPSEWGQGVGRDRHLMRIAEFGVEHFSPTQSLASQIVSFAKTKKNSLISINGPWNNLNEENNIWHPFNIGSF